MNAITSLERPQKAKLRIEDFELLEEAGAFDYFKKRELLDGVVVGVNAQSTTHSWAKNELGFRLRIALTTLRPELSVQIEPTVAIPPHSLPDPDIVVTSRPRDGKYVGVESAHLIVEIANTSTKQDLRDKMAIYACNNVPEYWVLEVRKRLLHRFWEPSAAGYRRRDALALGGVVTSVTIPGLTVPTEDLV